MDTRTHQEQQVDVEGQIAVIKASMPQTYQGIRDKAKVIGNEAFALVRRSLKGEPNCFYAIEAGWVMGAPFNLVGVDAELARYMCEFGCRYLIMWAPGAQPKAAAQQGAAHGAA